MGRRSLLALLLMPQSAWAHSAMEADVAAHIAPILAGMIHPILHRTHLLAAHHCRSSCRGIRRHRSLDIPASSFGAVKLGAVIGYSWPPPTPSWLCWCSRLASLFCRSLHGLRWSPSAPPSRSSAVRTAIVTGLKFARSAALLRRWRPHSDRAPASQRVLARLRAWGAEAGNHQGRCSPVVDHRADGGRWLVSIPDRFRRIA